MVSERQSTHEEPWRGVATSTAQLRPTQAAICGHEVVSGGTLACRKVRSMKWRWFVITICQCDKMFVGRIVTAAEQGID